MPIDVNKIILPEDQHWLIQAMPATGYSGKNSNGICCGLSYTLRDFAFKEPINRKNPTLLMGISCY